MRVAAYGWVRQNYHSEFLDDLTEIIYQFCPMKIGSNILCESEQMSLLNVLRDNLKIRKENEKVKSVEASLLYRGSEHKFSSKVFHKMCDKKGATLIIIHTESDHVFGGYVTQSWDIDEEDIFDPTAFLWIIRPVTKVFHFKKQFEDGIRALNNHIHYGPMFGVGPDLWIGAVRATMSKDPVSFEFDGHEMGGAMVENHKVWWFHIKEYEVFKITIE